MVGAIPGSTQERVDVHFDPGTSGTTLHGTIQGSEYIDYVLNAREGQPMIVVFEVTGTDGDGSAFFNPTGICGPSSERR